MCRGSKLTNSNNLNFRLARDQVVLLETAANSRCVSRRQANDFSQFFLIFELGGKTKHLHVITGSVAVTVTIIFISF